MTEVQRLKDRLQENGIRIINVFPGTSRLITEEEVAAEINRSLDNILSGNYTEVTGDENE